MFHRGRSILAVVVLLVAATFVAFSPALWCDFVNLDDGVYVVFNDVVRQGLSPIGWVYAWTEIVCANWHPVTMLSLELDTSLWGSNSTGYHATNLALHTINVLLLFTFLLQTTQSISCSAVAAAFFGLHPLHVESVAWISERKDVLSACFLLLTVIAYTNYTRRPSIGRYVLVCVLFAIGLMSKPMLVTLPVLLLLLDYWPLNRLQFRRTREVEDRSSSQTLISAIREKIPLFGLSLADGLVTIFAQKDAQNRVVDLMFGTQLANIFNAYCWYLQKTFVPTNLMAFYPHPGSKLSWIPVATGALLFCLISAFVWSRCWGKPHLLFGWCWFTISLLPVIGIIQVGGQAYADRYVYIPHIGLFVAIVWEIYSWKNSSKSVGLARTILVSIALLACGWLTFQQTQVWKDSKTLWRHALSINPDNGRAHLSLANTLQTLGENEEAVYHFEEGERLSYEMPVSTTYFIWGKALMALNRASEAEVKLRKAIEINPDHTIAIESLLQLLRKQNRDEEVEQLAQQGVSAYVNQAKKSPYSLRAQISAGEIEMHFGNLPKALSLFERAVMINPNDASAHYHLALARMGLQKIPEAKSSFRRVIKLFPEGAPAYVGLAQILEFENDREGAKQNYAKAVELEPSNLEYRHRLEGISHP